MKENVLLIERQHSRFTLSSYNDDEILNPKPKHGYDSIKEAVDWCKANGVYIGDVRITEWDIDSPFDAYGVPDIVAGVNLEMAVADKATDLGLYI